MVLSTVKPDSVHSSEMPEGNAPELPPNVQLALEWGRSMLQALKVIVVTLALTIYHSCLALIPSKYYPKKSIEKQTVLITGAGSGLGRLLALKMADLGAKILALDIDEPALNETLRLINKRKPDCEPKSYICDLGNREDIYSTAEKVKREFKTIDILINNAGLVSGKDIFECPDDKIVKVMNVNTMAHVWMAKAFLPPMMERNSGHLVTIASAAGLMPVNGLADYCASKYAAVGFHEAVDLEISAKGLNNISLTLVCPYYVNTGMFEGVTTKFPSILPIMDPQYVCDKIVDAILMNQKMLLLPRSIYFFYALKGILPTWVGHALSKNLELTDSMNNFVGRKDKRN